MIPDCDAPCFLFAISYLKSLKNVIRILSEATSSAVSQYDFTHLFYFFSIFCTKTGILHPSQFGVIEGRNIFSSSITLKTEYPASWDDTGAECACLHACIEKTLRKNRDRNGPIGTQEFLIIDTVTWDCSGIRA